MKDGLLVLFLLIAFSSMASANCDALQASYAMPDPIDGTPFVIQAQSYVPKQKSNTILNNSLPQSQIFHY
jgi:hypothetical protein